MILAALFLASGCSDSESPPDSTGNGVVDSNAGDAGKVEQVELAISSFEDLQSRIAKHKGKVVVVDYWSTSCEPCVEEFPNLVELSVKYPQDKLACISASLDFEDFGDNTVEKAQATALKFLQEQNARIENIIFNEDSIEVMENQLKIPGIPAIAVFDQSGTLVKLFDESLFDTLGRSFTYKEDIVPFVDDLIAGRRSGSEKVNQDDPETTKQVESSEANDSDDEQS